MKKANLETENISKLILDKSNPRFAELYDGSSREEDLIEYLLYTESGEDIAKNISEEGEFYLDRPLWVLIFNDFFFFLLLNNSPRLQLSSQLISRFHSKHSLLNPLLASTHLLPGSTSSTHCQFRINRFLHSFITDFC